MSLTTCTNKKKTPIEIQRECVSGQKTENSKQPIEEAKKLNLDQIAIIAAIEAGLPCFAFFDTGKEVNACSQGFSKPAILGLLLTFLERFKKEMI